MELRTTGGDCRNVVQRALTTFFRDCGLPEHFQWAEGAFMSRFASIVDLNSKQIFVTLRAHLSHIAGVYSGDWAYTMEELTATEEEEQQQKQ